MSFGQLAASQKVRLDRNQRTALSEGLGHLSAVRHVGASKSAGVTARELQSAPTSQRLRFVQNLETALPEGGCRLGALDTMRLE